MYGCISTKGNQVNDRLRALSNLTSKELLGMDPRRARWQEVFAGLVVDDVAAEMVVSNMSNPHYAKAMDAYYEKKWSHRFD